MAERRMKTAVIVFVAGAMIHLIVGVMAGLGEDWGRMSMFLFIAVFSVFCAMGVLFMTTLKEHVARLEDRFHVERTAVPARVRHLQAALGIFMITSIAVHMSLSIVAGLRGDWLGQGLYMAACATTVIVCLGIVAGLTIKTRFSSLEQQTVDKPVNSAQS